MKKDYSLLRPFDDLNPPKRGELVCLEHNDASAKFVAGPDAHGRICVTCSDGGFNFWKVEHIRMAPLGWVEGKPVYKGDELWYLALYRRGVGI